MHGLANVLVTSSVRYWRMELMRLISMYGAEVADGSRKLNIGIAERDFLWVWQGRAERGW